MSKVCEKHDAEYVEYSGKMRCPDCSRASARKYNAKNSDKRKKWHRSEAGKISRRKYEQSDKGKSNRKSYAQRENYKVLARKAVCRAVKKRTLIVPDVCSGCLRVSKVEAHHHLGYEKTHQLDVVWLCRSCHAPLHHNNQW